jgi:hypothetical protein
MKMAKQSSTILVKPKLIANKDAQKDDDSLSSYSESESDADHAKATIVSVSVMLNKLKQAEPEALILNYDASIDNSLYGNAQEEGTEVFAFAAFVPPGKHCIIVQDQGKYFYKNLIIQAR